MSSNSGLLPSPRMIAHRSRTHKDKTGDKADASKRFTPPASLVEYVRNKYIRGNPLGLSSTMTLPEVAAREDRYRGERAKATADSRAKKRELKEHGVDYHDWQDEADYKQASEVTSYENYQKFKANRAIAEQKREDLMRREEEIRQRAFRAA